MSTTTTGYATDYITFSRASLATVTGSGGLIQWAGHNFILSSEQFDSGNWSRVNTQAFGSGSVSNAIAAPNGTTTADFIAETNAASAQHIFYNTTNFALETSTNYTFGAFAKKGTRNYVSLAVNSGGGAGAGVVYDLNAGAVTQSSTTSAAYTIVSSSISSVGNDWYYCVFTFSSTQVTASTCICLSDSGTPTVQASTQRPLYTGDGVSGLYVWGAHLYRSDLGGMVANTSAYPMYNSTSPNNFVGYTENLTNAVWTATNLSVTANDTTAPNGIVSADKITGNGVLGGHVIRQTVTFTAYTTYTASVYVKASDLSWMYIYMGGTGITSYSTFNSSTGTVGTVDVGTTSRSITSVGNGWYRVQITATTGATVGSNFLEIAILTSDSVGSNTASGSIYVWGAQVSNSASLDAYSPNYFAFAASAAYNGPRLDYIPTTLAAKGILVEDQRTNLLTYSDQFNNAAWTKLATTVTANATISPDGTSSADKIIPDATTSTKYFEQLIATSASTAYSWSIFLKAAEYTTAVIYAINPLSPFQYFQASINLTTGVVSGTTSGNGGTFTAATATSYGNGWWRVSLIGTIGVGTSFVARVYPNTIASFTGDGTSGIYAWGAQLEAGTFESSYIPTTSASVTRSGDVATVATSAFPYNAAEGTIVVNGTTPNANSVNPGGGVPALVTLTDGTTNNRIQFIRNATGNNIVYGVFSGGASQASLTTTTSWANDTTNKIAAVWASNDFAVAFSADAVLTDTSGLLPVGIIKLNIGSRDGTSYWFGWIRQITYFPRRLTDAELQARAA